MTRCCSVVGCSSSSDVDGRRFYRFPKDRSVIKKWSELIGRPELQDRSFRSLYGKYFVCEFHFVMADRLRRSVAPGAVPKLLLPTRKAEVKIFRVSEENAESDASMRSSSSNSESSEDDAKCDEQSNEFKEINVRKFVKCEELDPLAGAESQDKYVQTDGKTLSMEKAYSFNIISTKTPAPVKRFPVSTYGRVLKLSKMQRLMKLARILKPVYYRKKLSKNTMFLALNLYIGTPSTYRMFGKSLHLPNESVFRRINMYIGISLDNHMLKCLEMKYKNVDERLKYCTICAGVVSLRPNLYYQIDKDRLIGFHDLGKDQRKEPATLALILYAKGLYSNWKQPLAYCFLADDKVDKKLEVSIRRVIGKALDVGLKVVAFVVDQHPIFTSFASRMSITVEHPYFTFKNAPIYYIFDVNNLVRSLRNDLMKCDLQFIGKNGAERSAKWEDIAKLYEIDSNRVRPLTLLTKSHINPDTYEKLKLKLAADVFKYSNVAAMSFSIECGRMNESSLGTVEFIQLVSRVIEVLNSSSTKAGIESSTEILEQFERFVSNVTIIDDEETTKPVMRHLEHWQITVSSMKLLSKELKKAVGSHFLFTCRLSRASFDKTFSMTRQWHRDGKKITPIQFVKVFQKIFVEEIAKPIKDDSDNLETFLRNIIYYRVVYNADATLKEDGTTFNSGPLSIKRSDYRVDLKKYEALAPLCSYLFRKCLDVHKCDGIKQYLKAERKPKDFIRHVRDMDSHFKNFFQYNKTYKTINPVGMEIMKVIKDLNFTQCCPCFPNDYLKKLFIRFRIYHTLCSNNKFLKQKSKQDT